ncbi:hypothetical protein N7517_007685 [Penicillium concentricum]|uniref:Uncharacterized protein n=1 Tax=Penicillium concentricum TaxID=293559 RepID=A0A9W9SEC5_9EURO|nr:uncharacterized protein N7517_007685 [Penicillium concentricum]KAJ5375679.1 hypothetical protein N7517_007685 [Penicillium concentricum]
MSLTTKIFQGSRYESSGLDATVPFSPRPLATWDSTVPVLATRYWLYYIQHGVSHDVLTSQLQEYPS